MKEKRSYLLRAGPILAICLCAMLLAVSPAEATQTRVDNTTWNVDPYYEWNLVSGLPKHPGAPSPGGSMTGADEILDYYYTSWTRIDDHGVMPNDQLWYDLDGAAEVKAIYTSNYLYLGYATDVSDGLPKTWLVPSGGGLLDVVGETASFNLDPGDDFVWVIGGKATKYSREALNSGKDYMVSYRIHGIYNDPSDHTKGSYIPSDPTYVIGFEDGTDDDYQDFVAEVSKVAPVPEPLTILGMFLGLGSIGAYIRRRRMF